MKAITLRNLSPDIAKAVQQRAQTHRISLNRAVLELLEEALGKSAPAKTRSLSHHDLDPLAGAWSDRDAQEFDGALSAQRTVDQELWR